MTSKRFLTCAALLVAAAFPPAASAQLQVPPPQGDNVEDPIGLGELEPSPSVVGFDADTTNYTTQPQFNEFAQCGQFAYGKTIWGAFRTPRTGRLDVTAAGFDASIRLARATEDSLIDVGCSDRLAGRIESFPRDDLPTVKRNQVYYVQTGGAQQPDGSFAGGPVEVAVELLRPQTVIGADAGLTWRESRGGVRVTSVRIDGPRRATASLFCVPRNCGRPQRFRLKPTVFKGPLTVPVMAKRRSADVAESIRRKDPAANFPVYSSARQVFRNRRIRNGQTLAVAIQAEDQIGQVFLWRIRRGAAGPKQIRCVEPNSSRIKAQGRCNGT